MFPNIKWLRLVPDRPGRGGWNTGNHSFQQTPINDVRTLTGGHVYRGSWRKDFDPVEYPGEVVDANSVSCLSIHGYTYPSLTDPAAAPTIKILEQNVHLAGVSVVYDTNGTTRQSRPGTNLAGTFVNIAGRCLFGDGGAEALLMDDRTPAIHSQPNQNLGVDAPKKAMPLIGGAGGINYSPVGTAYATFNSKFVNSPNPNNLISTILTTDSVAVALINSGLNGYSFGGASPGGVVDVAGKTSNGTTFTATGTISITTGTSLVTLAGGTWPVDGEYCGLAINFNGYSFVIMDTINAGGFGSFDINGNAISLSNVQLLIAGVYDGPTLTNASYTITGSQFKMHTVSTFFSVTIGPSGYTQSTRANMVQVLVNAIQANGTNRNLGNISLGPVGGGQPSTVTDAIIGAGLKDLGTVASTPWKASDVGSTLVLDLGAGTMLVTTISAFVTASFVRLYDANPGGAIGAPGKRAFWGPNFTGCTDAAMDNNVTATLTSASSFFTLGDVGKFIMVAGADPGGAALYTTIVGWISATQVTLGAKNTSGGAITAKQAEWGSGLAGVHAGPTYAYAWYDPETGHMSNISPLATVPKPTTLGTFPDFANLSILFNINPGDLAYPDGYNYLTGYDLTRPSCDARRFSHVVFFRTLSTPGSSTLYPIGSLQPFVGKVHPGGGSTLGSWNPGQLNGWMGLPNEWVIPNATAPQQWYDFSSDSDLLLSGGFRAPQFTNGKPMVLLRGGATQPGYPYALAYWDRRNWIVNTQEPDKIAFSCDEAQCPLGVPEESYPPTNFLRLPSAADGKVMGMRTVGDMLLITTRRFAYIVVGNNESNYRLMKISSSMPGVGTYQMDEFPTYTGAEGEPTTVFFIGTDRIVYQWTIGGAVTPISLPIQDQLDAIIQQAPTTYGFTFVHCISAWGRRLVVVAPSSLFGSGTGLPTFIYDITSQVWSKSYRGDGISLATTFTGIAPMTTVYGASGVPVNELYAIKTPNGNPGVHAMSWIRDDVATCTVPFELDTFPLTLDGKKTRKQIVSVNLHATAGTWTGRVYVNDQSAATFTFATYPDPIDSIYAPTGIQGIVDDVVAQDLVTMAGQFNTDGAPLIGYRFAAVVYKDADTTPAKVYAIDIGYIDMENPGDGDA